MKEGAGGRSGVKVSDAGVDEVEEGGPSSAVRLTSIRLLDVGVKEPPAAEEGALLSLMLSA